MRELLAGLALALGLPVQAQTLTLAEVLDTSRRFAPQVQEALARLGVAAGRRLEAEGAFDTRVDVRVDARPTGFYDGRQVSALVTRPLADRGGEVFAGYRVSGGTFPVYEDESFTNRGGELKAGAVLALLRDRAIDERRFGRIAAENDFRLAETDVLLAAIGVQRRAIGAYLEWVAAGQRLRVFRALLAIAEERQAGFKRQVAAGARPAIIVTENEQVILRRRALVVDAERALEAAAQRLSLFWRDAEGRPRVPGPDRLPAGFPPPLPLAPDGPARALGRPELKAIEVRLDQAAQKLRLDENLRRPRLDLKAEASQDLGPVGLGGPSRTGFETKVGLSFSLPLERRVAEGRMAATRAEIRALGFRRQQLEEEILANLGALDADVRATRAVRALAEAERERAVALARAEQRRFRLGASDLFLTTVREEQAADAEVRAIDAALRQALAHADVAAATADLEALGLEPEV
ncbi:MAG: TolC family protein [Sphingomonadaceae bacterium]|uniref:TolC family protein n=1 Tax=Thermaurantiacus sp. TaxID=2820283 RepID=UPI00298EDA07|nr:TolC family protein [Thermaurantiacus sp.]MCS6986372.1 TolC family protein [Sphingomonadaceae bacterium]MDW8414366.1 TolC family protein [Thermaurantiacus sp.]